VEIRQPEDGEEKGSGSSSWDAAAPEIISFISSAGVLRDKKGIEQGLTSVALLHSFQTLLQGTAPAEQIKGISNLLSIFHFILRIFYYGLRLCNNPI
jgi:uncharacterized membrane protein|tara:strand:+ start:255 stop:545 length:291 start_codon:yes stop_codon:yes gene_type:complete